VHGLHRRLANLTVDRLLLSVGSGAVRKLDFPHRLLPFLRIFGLILLLLVPLTASWIVSAQGISQIAVEDLSVTPSSAKGGAPVTVSFMVANNGLEQTGYEIPVLIDDVLEGTVRGELPGGGRRTHDIQFVRTKSGIYQIQIGDASSEFSIDPAEFEVRIVEVFPSVARPGDVINVSARISNNGGIPGTYQAVLKLNGATEGMATGVLASGASKPLLFPIVVTRPGTHVISLADAADTVMVLPDLSSVELVDTIPLSPEGTTARNQRGEIIVLTGKAVKLRHGVGRELVVELPFSLQPGEQLVEFIDLATRASYSDGEIFLPMPVEARPREVGIKAEMEPPVGPGVTAVSTITYPVLQLPDISIDLSVADPVLGITNLKTSLVLVDAPLGSRLQLRVGKEIPQRLREQLNDLPSIGDNRVGEVAMVVELTEAITGKPVAIDGGFLEFSLPSLWVDNYGSTSSVRTFLAGENSPQIVSVHSTGIDRQGRIGFQAFLPRGLSSFSLVSLVPRMPDGSLLQDLVVYPDAAAPGDVVEVTGSVVNSSTERLVVPVTLVVDGKSLRTRIVVVDTAAAKSTSFHIQMNDAGMHTIGLNGRQAFTTIAEALDPLKVSFGDLQVSPADALPGEPVRISVQVTNTGERVGLARPVLRLNEVLTRELPIILQPGESRRVETFLSLNESGFYRIALGSLSGAVIVRPEPSPPVFVVEELKVTPHVADPGQAIDVAFKVANQGNSAGIFQSVLEVDSKSKLIGPFSLPAKTTLPFLEQVTIVTPGNHALKLGEEIAQIKVRKAAYLTFKVTNLEASPLAAKRGEPVQVTAIVTNGSDVVGIDEVVLKLDGMIAGSEWIGLGPGASREMKYTVSGSKLGWYELDLNGTESGFTVERAVSLLTISGALATGLLVITVTVYALVTSRRKKIRGN
jgi:hypothetical protein